MEVIGSSPILVLFYFLSILGKEIFKNGEFKDLFIYSILRDEMLNLREENEGVNIILKQANKSITKDKFSAFEYGLYYIKQEEDSKRKRKKGRLADFMFIS